jgi:hypothetical protein
MKKSILMICLTAAVFLGSCATEQQTGEITSIYTYEILMPDQPETDILDVNTYTAVHLLYMDIFYRLDLMDALSAEDKAEITGAMMNNISFRYPVNVIIRDYFTEGDLKLGIRLGQDSGPPYIVLMANMDRTNGRMISNEDSFGNAYYVLYYVVNGSMVRESNLFDPSMEQEYLSQDIPNNLADLYLFDEKPDNDRLIQGYLEEGVRGGDPFSRAVAHATWAQYCLSLNDYSGAAAHLEEVSGLRRKVTEEQSDSLQGTLYMMDEEIFIMRNIP